jgi:hypothetical protein
VRAAFAGRKSALRPAHENQEGGSGAGVQGANQMAGAPAVSGEMARSGAKFRSKKNWRDAFTNKLIDGVPTYFPSIRAE